MEMTLEASSIEAWCMWVVVVSPLGDLDFVVSRRQLARPAVLLSVLDQIMWTPPVEAESEAMRP